MDLWVRLQNVCTAVNAGASRITDFGYTDDPPEEAMSIVCSAVPITICSIVEEEYGCTYTQWLSTVDDSWLASENNAHVAKTLTVKRVLESIWGIRIAFTHANRQISKITNPKSKHYAVDAPTHIKGVEIRGDVIYLSTAAFHTMERAVLLARSLSPP